MKEHWMVLHFGGWIWNFQKLQLLMDMPKMWGFELFWLFFFQGTHWTGKKNRFESLSREKIDKTPTPDTTKPSFVEGLKFCSININSIRGKILKLLAFLDAHQPHVVASQETKIDSPIPTSELSPENCMYSVYRKDRNTRGGGVMLLIHSHLSHAKHGIEKLNQFG